MTLLVYFDANLRVRFVNRHCARLLGCARRQLVGRRLAELLDARTLRYALAHLDELDRGHPTSREYVLRHQGSGELRRVRLQALADRDESGAAVGYLACSAAGARAFRLAAAHELRTPLASVVAALDLLLERSPGPDTTVGRWLGTAIDGAERLSQAVEKWLDEPR
jgi:signal transduction histidine kinase